LDVAITRGGRLMSENESRPKPFYKDRDDTLEDVGITPKQLRTWREAGLFKAELGPNTRKFTAADITDLRLLKRLIVGLGLPIQTVQQLADGLPSPYTIPLGFTYLNVKTGKLVRPRTALQEMTDLYASDASLGKLEDWLLTLTLRYFEQIKSAYRSPKVYEAKRDELLERLRRMDLAARAEDPEEDFEEDDDGNPVRVPPRFIPSVAGDPDPTHDLLQKLAGERERRLAGIKLAKVQAMWEEWERQEL
jgi:DNA-binding transcriptional MerR regulator